MDFFLLKLNILVLCGLMLHTSVMLLVARGIMCTVRPDNESCGLVFSSLSWLGIKIPEQPGESCGLILSRKGLSWRWVKVPGDGEAQTTCASSVYQSVLEYIEFVTAYGIVVVADVIAYTTIRVSRLNVLDHVLQSALTAFLVMAIGDYRRPEIDDGLGAISPSLEFSIAGERRIRDKSVELLYLRILQLLLVAFARLICGFVCRRIKDDTVSDPIRDINRCNQQAFSFNTYRVNQGVD